ncbi:MAG: cation diffusion facilitator family transporter [Defluviitaleaceae bacterium]|nr:cation diffusion facilitator family transporter [Defluviitaleaceae bacterium]
MLLTKLFIKNHQDTESPTVRERYGLLSGTCGIILNILLSAIKFVVGSITNSVSITADAFNNLTDCLTSLLTILGFRWSAKPADREHPFGHSRIEYLISLAVAGIILLTGYEVMRSSVSMIINPEPVYFYPMAVAALIFGMVVKLWMAIFNKKLGRAIKSDTLLAVGIDSRNDVIITAATLVSLIISRFVDFHIDGYIGALIAFVFLRSGYKVAKEALGRIIGNPTDISLAAEIKEIIKSHEGILGAHDLVVHSYGPGRDMASIHVEVAADMSLADSHEIVENAANAVLEKLGILMVIHLDPIDLSDKRLQGLISLTQSLLTEKYPTLCAHEFRIVNSVPKDKLVFDMEIPHESRKKAPVLREAVIQDIVKLAPGYDVEINIEYGYVE